MAYLDKTLETTGRTDLNMYRPEITGVLPSHFSEDYPQLIKLFEAYYEFMDDSDQPNGRIKNLSLSRDATQMPESNLVHLEDELLLGQAYFGGFINKREAIKFSNLLFRSKGSKFSLEQFFRAFYDIDAAVTYPKDNIFKIGPAIDEDLNSSNNNGEQVKTEASQLGPESRKFITDDKLYQTYSINIRSSLPISEYIDVYKLFVHPAGMYLGSELLIETVNTNTLATQPFEGDQIVEQVFIVAVADGDFDVIEQTTLLEDGDDATPIVRTSLSTQFDRGGEVELGFLDSSRTLFDVFSPTSELMDDSADTSTIRFDQDSDQTQGVVVLRQTLDQHKYSTEYDSA